ncbi:CLUMA_CG002822, isoform A [Clunio marinus]|uniref:CLUMA_CG002822, isoform A n=1 Tax=Clunio marinus TaxID=568069 RepID=A0A1J1HKX9_9DIPT|nr:CLUMA_CG002822, isoform A [Clunio marinus]
MTRSKELISFTSDLKFIWKQNPIMISEQEALKREQTIDNIFTIDWLQKTFKTVIVVGEELWEVSNYSSVKAIGSNDDGSIETFFSTDRDECELAVKGKDRQKYEWNCDSVSFDSK